jgi:hypothetical protein
LYAETLGLRIVVLSAHNARSIHVLEKARYERMVTLLDMEAETVYMTSLGWTSELLCPRGSRLRRRACRYRSRDSPRTDLANTLS